MKKFSIKIPKPCHEGWENMTPNEKGRFCKTCSKTVIDFTKKSSEEIRTYFQENRGKRICGHFKKSLLNSVVIEIPEVSFQSKMSFQKIFFLALLLAMGTTLFSCKSEGKTKKIEAIEVVENFEEAWNNNDSLENDIDEIEQNTEEIEGELEVEVGEASLYETEIFFKKFNFKGDFDKKPTFKKYIKLNEALTDWILTYLYSEKSHENNKITLKIDKTGNISFLKAKGFFKLSDLKKHEKEFPKIIPATKKGKPVNSILKVEFNYYVY